MPWRQKDKVPGDFTGTLPSGTTSGQLVSGGQQDAVPVLAGQGHVRRLAAVLQTLHVHGARHRLHVCRVTEQPRDGDGRVAHAVLRGDLVNLRVQFGELRVVEEHALEEAEL